ncbi:hypothetical protein HY413_03060 [Candidatus Kaiserbacteria bacterium]|nr:hypothetical protein [Candidatus Kaiserbacteria bacterium]
MASGVSAKAGVVGTTTVTINAVAGTNSAMTIRRITDAIHIGIVNRLGIASIRPNTDIGIATKI